MKPPKLTPKEKALERNPELYAELQDGNHVIILPTRSGRHPIGRGETEEAAWKSATTIYYGIK